MSDLVTLDATLDAVWATLALGVRDRSAPGRHPVLATVGRSHAEARVVVLRGADRAKQSVVVHTDARSEKVRDLVANSRATLLIWDADQSFQVRLRVTVDITVGDEAAWSTIPAAARQVYGGAPYPGEALETPDSFVASPDVQRFAQLFCRIDEIETLHLGTRHRRARFRDATGVWVAP